MSRLLSLLLLITAPVRAEAPAPAESTVSEPAPDDPSTPPHEPDTNTPQREPLRWSAWLGGGFTMVMLEQTPLGDQLNAAGYHVDVIGPAFSLSLEHHVLDWLVVGGSLDLRWVEGGRDHGRLRGRELPFVDMSFWRVGAGAYVQPTLCLLYGGCRNDGLFFGLLVGMSTGPTLWNLRDATEVGAFFRFDFALSWSVQVDRFLLALKVGHAMLWQSDMGPNDLGHGFEWTPTIELRTGWRW